MKDHIIILASMICLGIAFFALGMDAKQRQIEKRALELKMQENYNWQHIEMVVFGEIQE